jgi:hypothetical protein
MDVGDLLGGHAPQVGDGLKIGPVVADGDLDGLAAAVRLVGERPARQLRGQHFGFVDAVDQHGGRTRHQVGGLKEAGHAPALQRAVAGACGL